MTSSRQDQLIALIQEQIRPAVGCTEPGAAAYAAAVAAQTLGETPERLTVSVSRNILKNAMGVGLLRGGLCRLRGDRLVLICHFTHILTVMVAVTSSRDERCVSCRKGSTS